MQNLQNELINILQHEDALVVDGQLNKNKIVEMALQVDPKLIKHLIKHDTFKTHFFTDVEGVLVFDKIKFQRFVNNKSFLPDSYTAFKNKIGLTINDGTTDNYITTKNDVVLAWPHKDCVLEGGQTKEDQKRNEIFWNETLAPDEIDRLLDPKVFTNWKKYDQKGEHELTEISDNVKLIYIDPPYNTGSDSFQYNDNFNHSTWLTFIKNRLLYAKNMMHETGFIFVSCDDSEEAYLKVILDEVFGRENFVNTISYERSGSAGIGQGGFFVDTAEFILVYSKNKSSCSFNQVTKSSLLDYEVMKRYNNILEKEGEKELIKEFKSKSNGEPVKIFKHTNYNIEKVSLKDYEKREIEIRKSFKENFSKVFRTTNPQAENSFQQELLSYMDNGLYSVEYTPSRGKNKDIQTTTYYLGNGIFAWLKDSAHVEGANVVKENKLTTLWSHAEIPKADLANEGDVNLKRGKKPEQLLNRIIELSTNEGDLVLDFFIGSGTTCAVSHKMKRKYIGIEQLNYGENDSVIRLKNVIGKTEKKQGELMPSDIFDKSGVSKKVNWQGGGSFIYCELAKYNQTYADQILEADSKEKLIAVWQQMKEKAFLSYQFDKQSFDERIEAFKTLSLDDQKKFLLEVLDKNQLYVNFSEMADETYGISEADKKLNKQFYNIL